MLKSLFLMLTIGLSSATALGAPAYDGEGIPTFVYYQLGNFAVFLGLLYFVLRKRVPAFFAAKKEKFLLHEKKAREERERAQRARDEIDADLKKLVSGAAEGLRRAEDEGRAFAEKMRGESQSLVARLTKELERTEAVEMEKVAHSVRSLLIEKSVGRARETIKKDLLAEDDIRLRSEFVEKIQVVN